MLLDLTDRAKFIVTGNDRLRFLNGQLTNDILSLRPDSAIYACALTAKGKLCADLFVTAAKENLFLDAESLLRESLPARLERYIIADDVTLEDVTGAFGLFHLLGPELGDARSLVPASLGLSGESDALVAASTRFGVRGIDLWFPVNQAASVLEQFKRLPVDSEAAENFRIEQGIARWGNELSEEVIPIEAGLEKHAINYTKGCYLGQEVISRIKSVGHVNRQLCGLLPDDGIVLQIGDKLFSDLESTKEIGFITSIGWSRSLDRAIALGFVRRGFEAPGSTLQVRRNNTLIGPIEVRSLPFNSA